MLNVAPRAAVKGARYAHRVTSVGDGPLACDVLIDGLRRFRIEGSDAWPAQWRLYAVVDGVRADHHLALENEQFDILDQLERGEHWMPRDAIDRAPSVAPRSATRVRFPEYLADR